MARYFLRFRHTDNALTPSFTYFKNATTLADVVSPPSILGPVFSDGSYYFDYSPTFDIVYEVDGGASITDVTIRYISDTIGPRDVYIDEPTSQVVSDVWNDTTTYSAGKKGHRVDDIGAPADLSGTSTLFGVTKTYKELVRGDDPDTSDGKSNLNVFQRIGPNMFGSIGDDIAALYANTGRVLGLVHENTVLDNTTFNGANKLTSGRLRLYDSKTNALAAGGTGLIATYTITASYTGSNVQQYTVVLEP